VLLARAARLDRPPSLQGLLACDRLHHGFLLRR
jgi:hypothetical protein